jgi:hypothetical protein
LHTQLAFRPDLDDADVMGGYSGVDNGLSESLEARSITSSSVHTRRLQPATSAADIATSRRYARSSGKN